MAYDREQNNQVPSTQNDDNSKVKLFSGLNFLRLRLTDDGVLACENA